MILLAESAFEVLSGEEISYVVEKNIENIEEFTLQREESGGWKADGRNTVGEGSFESRLHQQGINDQLDRSLRHPGESLSSCGF